MRERLEGVGRAARPREHLVVAVVEGDRPPEGTPAVTGDLLRHRDEERVVDVECLAQKRHGEGGDEGQHDGRVAGCGHGRRG
jgi:hypothetical protein